MANPKNIRQRGGVPPTDVDALLGDDVAAETAAAEGDGASVLSDKVGFGPSAHTDRAAAPAPAAQPTEPAVEVTDAVLGGGSDSLEAPASASAPATIPSGESPEAARIRELEAALRAAQASTPVAPESSLTEEQRRIRDLEDQLARSSAAQLDRAEEVFVPPTPGGDTILLHFLEDGFTALGRVWYRGQELEFEVGSQAYNDTKDRYGKTWLALLDNEYDQVQRYGKVMFRRGPWPGQKWSDDASAEAERKRNRMAPVLPAR